MSKRSAEDLVPAEGQDWRQEQRHTQVERRIDPRDRGELIRPKSPSDRDLINGL